MNLAIEYFIRSGAAKDSFKAPCALYLEDIQNNQKRLIVTIQNDIETNQYLIKKWNVNKFDSDEILPESTVHFISKNDLFTSQYVIVPKYNMINFKENAYPRGVRQRFDGAYANMQNQAYNEILDLFLYPETHTQHRLLWLWRSFLIAHNIELNFEYTIAANAYYIMDLTQKKYPSIWKIWEKWQRKFIYYHNNVAPELIFADAYSKKISSEREKNPKWFSIPTSHFKPLDNMQLNFVLD